MQKVDFVNIYCTIILEVTVLLEGGKLRCFVQAQV